MAIIIRIIDQPDDAKYQEQVKTFLRGIRRGTVVRMNRPCLVVKDHEAAEQLLRDAAEAGIKAELLPSDK
jgi:hypothetical protein